MSSAERSRPFGTRLWVSMYARTALRTASLKPCSCVPPSRVGMPLTNVRMLSLGASVHCSATSTRCPPPISAFSLKASAWTGRALSVLSVAASISTSPPSC